MLSSVEIQNYIKEGFVKTTLERIKQGSLKEDFYPKSSFVVQVLQSEIQSAVCEYYEMRGEEIPDSQDKSPRNAAIYLLKKFTGLTNRR